MLLAFVTVELSISALVLFSTPFLASEAPVKLASPPPCPPAPARHAAPETAVMFELSVALTVSDPEVVPLDWFSNPASIVFLIVLKEPLPAPAKDKPPPSPPESDPLRSIAMAKIQLNRMLQ